MIALKVCTFVRYVDPESDNKKKDEGFLSKMVFWKSSPSVNSQTQYRIFVSDSGKFSTIQVLSREGGVDQSETAKKILSLLYDQLK